MLRWEYRIAPSCEPSGFRVQIATDRSFTNVIDQVNLGAAARDYTPSGPLADCTTYSWRVYGRRSDGVLGPASAVFSFTLQIGRCV
jgi:hypothetical protein